MVEQKKPAAGHGGRERIGRLAEIGVGAGDATWVLGLPAKVGEKPQQATGRADWALGRKMVGMLGKCCSGSGRGFGRAG